MKLIFKISCLTIMCCVTSAQTCLICVDGTVPQHSDTLLKFFPGTLPQNEYTCKELHFLGMYNDGNVITPEICTFLVKLASFSCGCHGEEADQGTNISKRSETQTMDVTVTGASNDVILSSTVVATKTANSTSTILTSSTNPTTTPSLPSQPDASYFPSSIPSTIKRSTLAPSFSPYSTRHTLTSIEMDIEETVTDHNYNEVTDHSLLMEIFQKLKVFLFHFENDEKPNQLPKSFGKLRGM